MRKTNLLLSTAVTYLAASLASQAAVTNTGLSRGATNTAVSVNFITAPYVVGGQPLFTSTIVSVNPLALSLTPALTGNNVSPAPQGGLGVAQGGVGVGARSSFSTSNSLGLIRGIGGVSTGDTSSSNGSSSSQGFSSANNTSGLSSAGFSSSNNSSGLSSAGTTSMNNTSGTSSAGFSSANNSAGSSSVGQNSSNNLTNATSGQIAGNGGNTTARPVLLLTSLINSTNPKFGSAGALFQGVSNTPISTISFQFGQLANLSGVTTQTNLAPVLVIDDGANGLLVNTRFLPVTAGTLHNDGNGLTTVTFTSNQLNISGLAQKIGVAFSQQGTVVVDNILVNGQPSTGIIAQSSPTFPF